ncbi:MAG: low molecular weight protein arginine phosphatase, partial [Bacillota bacterium]
WEAVEVMARKGIDISAHISRPVEYEDIENADLVITMTEAHKSMLLFGYPEFATKIYTLSEMLGEFWGDVIDPFGQGLEAYERTADFLEDSLRVLAKRLAGLDV